MYGEGVSDEDNAADVPLFLFERGGEKISTRTMDYTWHADLLVSRKTIAKL